MLHETFPLRYTSRDLRLSCKVFLSSPAQTSCRYPRKYSNRSANKHSPAIPSRRRLPE